MFTPYSHLKNLCIAVLFSVLTPLICLGGGGEYEMADDTQEAGPAFFGFVRDERGANLAGAKAILTTKSGITVEVKTNVLGVYRSHVAKNVTPKDVTLSCQMAGYAPLKTLTRSNNSDRFVETDCIMKRITQAPTPPASPQTK